MVNDRPVIAAVLHVIPKGAANGVVPQGNKNVVGFSLAVAVAIAGLILAVRQDPKPLIQMRPNWTRDAFHTGALSPSEGPPG